MHVHDTIIFFRQNFIRKTFFFFFFLLPTSSLSSTSFRSFLFWSLFTSLNLPRRFSYTVNPFLTPRFIEVDNIYNKELLLGIDVTKKVDKEKVNFNFSDKILSEEQKVILCHGFLYTSIQGYFSLVLPNFRKAMWKC